MNRREIFPILGLGAMSFEAAAAEYKPRVFTAAEYATLTAAANLILPADSRSKGAGDAGAAFFIDTLLFHSPEASRKQFRERMQPLTGKSGKALDRGLARMSAAKDPFFERMKLMVVDAYCLSEDGKKYLLYTGDGAIEEFKGCDHPEHLRS